MKEKLSVYRDSALIAIANIVSNFADLDELYKEDVLAMIEEYRNSTGNSAVKRLLDFLDKEVR